MKTLLRTARRPECPVRVGVLVPQIRASSTKSNKKQRTPAYEEISAGSLRFRRVSQVDRRHQAVQLLRAEIGAAPSRIPGRKPSVHKRNHFEAFSNLVLGKFDNLTKELVDYEAMQNTRGAAEVGREANLFRRNLVDALVLAGERGLVSLQQNPLFFNLRNAFIKRDIKGLLSELKYSFENFILQKRLPKATTEKHMEIADLRFPYEWFPATRMIQRTIHLHVGPTNSGKTYNALKALEGAKTGIYAGPLRLLAHEIYSRLEAKGKPCALVTGEERRYPEKISQYFQSCTVEMTPLNTRVDVAVIDEIQMIADQERGWAWTQAVLGVQATEVHLCGEERAVPLIKELCARINDKVVVHRYDRLNPLTVMDESLKGEFQNLQKGDCVVSFTRVGLHRLKATIERATGRRCAIVYGSLPPETRVQQAALFNDPDNDYDFLVASDAIGMGLNLEIRRVIFETTGKWDGIGWRILNIPEIKQIGGRAGRYKTAKQANQEASTVAATDPESGKPPAQTVPGYVATLDDEDIEAVRDGFRNDAPLITTAGLKPPSFIVERFASHFHPSTPFSFVLARLRELCRLSERFFLCEFKDSIEIAEHIHDCDLSAHDRVIFAAAPVTLNDPGSVAVMKEMASCVANNQSGHLLDLKTLDLEILEVDPNTMTMSPQNYLSRLESVHKGLTMYLWLSYHYEGIFQSQRLAFHTKSLIEEKIRGHLESLNFTPTAALEFRERQRKRMLKSEAELRKRATIGSVDVDSENNSMPNTMMAASV